MTSKQSYKYFVTFEDDYSRATLLHSMKFRFELFTMFCNFCAKIRTQFNCPVHILHSDNDKEYFSTPFRTFMNGKDMIHQSPCIVTRQNGWLSIKTSILWKLLEH